MVRTYCDVCGKRIPTTDPWALTTLRVRTDGAYEQGWTVHLACLDTARFMSRMRAFIQALLAPPEETE